MDVPMYLILARWCHLGQRCRFEINIMLIISFTEGSHDIAGVWD